MTHSTTAKSLIEHRSSVDPWGQNRAALEEHAELAKALNEEARENWDNPAWHRQVARDIAETLEFGFVFDNLFSNYIRVQNVGEFDRVILRERRGLKVFYTSRGGYIEESQIRTETWEMPRDTLGFHVSEHTDKLRANFATTMEDLVNLGESKLNAEVNRRLVSMIFEAIPVGSPFYATVPSLDKVTLDAAIREVQDNVQPDNSGAAPPVSIVGRAAVIDQVSDLATTPGVFDPEANMELRRRGMVGTYRGAQVIKLTNYADEDGKSYIPANELLVFAGNTGRFAMYGGMQVKSWEENTVDYTHYRARKDVGGMVNHPEQARRIVVSGVTP